MGSSVGLCFIGCHTRFVADLNIIGGDLPGFPGDSCSTNLHRKSVFVSVALRGAKKLLVNTSFGVSLRVTDIGLV
jgi:hypothetical protein